MPRSRDVLLVCPEMELLGGTFFAWDGLKLPAKASKAWRGTRSALHRQQARLAAQVTELFNEHIPADNQDDPSSGPGGSRDREHQGQRLPEPAERLEPWRADNAPQEGAPGHGGQQ